jgi:hypothetical protein
MRNSRQLSPAQIMIDQQQMENVEHFNCLGTMITNYARCTCDIKSRNAVIKAAFDKKNFHQKIRIKCKEETSKALHLEHGFCDNETWTLQKVDKKKTGKF